MVARASGSAPLTMPKITGYASAVSGSHSGFSSVAIGDPGGIVALFGGTVNRCQEPSRVRRLMSFLDPWSDPSGSPVLVVNQPRLGIADLKIVFVGESATYRMQEVVFDQPARVLPFGTVKFDDLTSLPGTVTIENNNVPCRISRIECTSASSKVGVTSPLVVASA